MRDETGEELSDVWEAHVIELRKELQGTGIVDDWIRLLNAKSEEDLEMIKTKSLGIMEAIEVLKEMSLTKSLRYRYETELKLRRDRKAQDDYVRDEGRAEGKIEGKIEGIISQVRKKMRKNMSMEEIAEVLEEDATAIMPIYALLQQHPDWDDERIYKELTRAKGY